MMCELSWNVRIYNSAKRLFLGINETSKTSKEPACEMIIEKTSDSSGIAIEF